MTKDQERMLEMMKASIAQILLRRAMTESEGKECQEKKENKQ